MNDDCESDTDVDWTDVNYDDVEDAVLQLIHIGKTDERCNLVECLYADTPIAEGIHDANTVLADLMDDVDFHEVGLGLSVIDIWQYATDKEPVEEMFYALTGCKFMDFLNRCVKETT